MPSPDVPRYTAYRSTLAQSVPVTPTHPESEGSSERGVQKMPSTAEDESKSSGDAKEDRDPGKMAEVQLSPPPVQRAGETMSSAKGGSSGAIKDDDDDDERTHGDSDAESKDDPNGSGTKLSFFLEKAEKEKPAIPPSEMDMHTSWSEFDPADMPGPSTKSAKQQANATKPSVIQQALASEDPSATKLKSSLREDIQKERLRAHEEKVQEIADEEEANRMADIETGMLHGGGNTSENPSLLSVHQQRWRKQCFVCSLLAGIVLLVFAFITAFDD